MAEHHYDREVVTEHHRRRVDDLEAVVLGATTAHRRLEESLRRWESAPGAPSDPVGAEEGRIVDRVIGELIRGAAEELERLGRSRSDHVAMIRTGDRAEVVAGANRELESMWNRIDRVATERSTARRWRAVEVAHLGLGASVASIDYAVADLPAEFVRRQLRELEMVWSARRSLGLTGLPMAAQRLEPAERLGWLLGVVDVPGLAPSGLADRAE